MRQRSETWAKLAARGRFNVDVRAVIGGVEYTAISAPIIDRALFTDTLSVGNCIAASMQVAVLTEDTIPTAASVVIKARIFSGDTYSEWKNFGTFYISNRQANNGLVSLQCYDTMLKANQRYVDPSNSDDRIGWPKSMQTCVQEIAQRIGVEIDPRTVINTDEAYQVPYPTDYTMQQVLGFIGACHGGNWIITPEDKLRLVPLISPPPETFDIVDYYYNKIYTDDGYKLVWKNYETGEPVSNGAGGDVVNVPVVIDKITTGNNATISRVTIARDEELGYTEGDDTGTELRIDSNPYANQAVCDGLYAAVNGVVYAPFTATKACYDPCTELGDWILIGDQVRSVLYHQVTTFSVDFRADVSAPGKEEASDEYPYLTEIEKLHLEDERLKVYMDEAKKEVDSQILQTRQEITLEVTARQNLEGTVNALDARIIVAEGNITAEVSRAKDSENALTSRISATETQIELKVSKGDVSSQISVESGKVTIGANRLTIESDNFTLSGSGEVSAKGTITSENGSIKTTVSAGEVGFYYDDSLIGSIKSKIYYNGDTGVVFAADGQSIIFSTQYNWNWTSIAYMMNNGKNPENCTERNIFFEGLRVFKDFIHAAGLTIDNVSDFAAGEVNIDAAVNSDGYYSCATVDAGLYAEGDLWCGGTKYRVVETENYGPIGLSAMESAGAVFSDVGSGTTDDTGVAYIFFDTVFAETVDLNYQYQVFLSPNKRCNIACVEKKHDYFLVSGDPGVSFDWIVFAPQKGYTEHRLECAKVYKKDRIKYDGSVFYEDDTGANRSMEYAAQFADTYDEQAAAYLNDYEQEVTDYGY